MTMTVGIGYVEVEGKGELVGRGTERTHVVRLADVVAGVRRTSKRRRSDRIEIDAMNTKSCFSTEEKTQGSQSDSYSYRRPLRKQEFNSYATFLSWRPC